MSPDPSKIAASAIRISHLTREFQVGVRGVRLRAVDDLNLTVRAGEVFGLLGPNGSGKSTTIKILLGLLPATSGDCRIFDIPCVDVRSRSEVGYLPEAPHFHRFLTGRELVEYYGNMCGLRGVALRGRAGQVLEQVGMQEAAHRRVGTYSKGMLQRIGLAQALVHDPRLVILDEPTAGVDPVGTAEFAELILRLKATGKTILLSSHLLAQVEGICDRVAILNKGRLILEGDVDSLVQAGMRDSLVVQGMDPKHVNELRAWLEQRGATLVRTEKPRVSLDVVFLKQVSRRPDPVSTDAAPPSS